MDIGISHLAATLPLIHRYKGQQVHRINSSFHFGAERWCITTALYFGVAERTRVLATATVVTISRLQQSLCRQPHQKYPVVISPACFSAARGGIRWVLHFKPRPRPLLSQAPGDYFNSPPFPFLHHCFNYIYIYDFKSVVSKPGKVIM